MAATSSSSVTAFLRSLPLERRREVERVRELVRRRLPRGYEETVSRNMVVYQVPLSRYPDTYNGEPLWYAALASEKSYLSLHLMPIYGSKALVAQMKARFRAAGKKLDIGKACVHFQSADDLDLDAIGDAVASVPVDAWVEMARAARRQKRRKGKPKS